MGQQLTSAVPEIYKDVTILVTLSALPTSPDNAPNLKLVHFISAGTNHISDSPVYEDEDITITTSSGIHGKHSISPVRDITCDVC